MLHCVINIIPEDNAMQGIGSIRPGCGGQTRAPRSAPIICTSGVAVAIHRATPSSGAPPLADIVCQCALQSEASPRRESGRTALAARRERACAALADCDGIWRSGSTDPWYYQTCMVSDSAGCAARPSDFGSAHQRPLRPKVDQNAGEEMLIWAAIFLSFYQLDVACLC